MKKETKELGMEIHPRKGVMKEEKFPNSRKSSHRWVCEEFWNLRGQHNQEEEKKKKPTEHTPNCISQRRSSPDAVSTTSEWGLDREVRVERLR